MFKTKGFHSLTSKLLFITAGAIVLSIVSFFGVKELGDFLVWRYFLADDIMEERAEELVQSLNTYVYENKLSVNDTDRVLDWTDGKQIDIILYRDSDLIYAPDWFINAEEQSESGVESGTLSESNKEADTETGIGTDAESGESVGETDSITEGAISNNGWFSGDRGFEHYLTVEAREEYLKALENILEGNAEMRPIYFIDGTLLVTIVDYSGEILHNLVIAIGLIVATAIVAIIMGLSLSRLSQRVKRLASKVKAVEEGRHDMPIELDGNDEIAMLASGVNSMRDSVVENMTKEKQAWEANAELITAMSHDIRTPLTVMLGYLDLMEMQNVDETSGEYITACKENAMRLKSLSDDMFSYFLVFGKGDISPTFTSHRADELLSHIFAERGLLLSQGGYDIRLEGEVPSVNIRLDEALFGRVVDNIFSNVTKYADVSSPVTISIECYGDRLSILCANRKRTDKHIPESNGIGLKTCKRIMEELGGDLTHKEENGLFTVHISMPVDNGDKDDRGN